MITQVFNWRTALSLIAIAIASGTIFYSNYLARKLAADERKKVNVWVQSLKTRAVVTEQSALDLTNVITNENTDIPIIETNESNIPSGNVLNLDLEQIKKDTNFLREKVREFSQQNDPFEIVVSKNPLIINKYFYGDSDLLKEVRYYPIIQLFIVGFFIVIVITTLSLRNRSAQNQVWVGLAKETAHQLGTPITSLQGWIEMLKSSGSPDKAVLEMEKDVQRLKLVSERFGKIGSPPRLENANLVRQVEEMVNYFRKRSPQKVSFLIDTDGKREISAMISPPLFDWVIENLLKNSLDAVEGQGEIRVTLREQDKFRIIDVTDNGKGIPKRNMPLVFKPGFTTKKRGWGLGLSLARRIVEKYHRGELYVKSSEPGKGTTFRLILKG